MPEYLTPGVYVEETSFRPKTIEGVSTSTAGFVGPARFGPTSGEPPLLTSFADFQRIYAGLEALDFADAGATTNHLAYAVRAFFEEGGQRCYVARVYDEAGQDEGVASATLGTNGITVEARYPGEVGNVRVSVRPVGSRDVSRVDRDEDDAGELPGVRLGDTVFGVPGVGTPLAANGAGRNFYDYVLDDDGEPALQNAEAGQSGVSVKAKELKAADGVFPLRVRVVVQRPIQRPGGGGVEFGPEEELGTFTLRPASERALVDALDAEDPEMDPHLTPIAVGALENQQGDPYETGTAYASSLFGDDPVVGAQPLQLPISVSGTVSGVASYEFTIPYEEPFDESVLQITGTDVGGTISAGESVSLESQVRVSVEADDVLEGSPLIKLETRLLEDFGSAETLTVERGEFRDGDGGVLSAQGLPTIDGPSVAPDAAGTEKTIDVPISEDLEEGDGVQAYSFDLPYDASRLAITGVSVEGTATPASATVRFSRGKKVAWSSSNGTLSGTGPLVLLQANLSGTAPADLRLEDVRFLDEQGQEIAVTLSAPNLATGEPADLPDVSVALTGGGDGNVPTSYVTGSEGPLPPNDPAGFDALEDLENVSIVAAPGYSAIDGDAERRNVQNELIGHCEKMRYRIGVLDTPPGSTVKEARDWRGNVDSKYAAMYHPWITIFDPISRSELNVPPSGHVAGIYARNDVENGVHKAPANEVVRSAVGFERRINKAQQAVLNPEGVNCFRFFEGRGNRLWGARMATSDSEFKYVNVRRYLAYLERSIDQGTQVFVFENNGADLWRNVRRTIGGFLKNEWRSDRLMGTTPEEAFFVRCDRSTMTQNDIDNGRLICEIGVALLKPAEFVIFRIGQKLMQSGG